jgi:hypothetical protein
MENITIVLFPTKPGKNGDCLENDRKKIKNNLSINNPKKGTTNHINRENSESNTSQKYDELRM